MGSVETFFLIKKYLGRLFDMSNKPFSKNLLNTASFYLGGRGRGGLSNGILAMSGM